MLNLEHILLLNWPSSSFLKIQGSELSKEVLNDFLVYNEREQSSRPTKLKVWKSSYFNRKWWKIRMLKSTRNFEVKIVLVHLIPLCRITKTRKIEVKCHPQFHIIVINVRTLSNWNIKYIRYSYWIENLHSALNFKNMNGFN